MTFDSSSPLFDFYKIGTWIDLRYLPEDMTGMILPFIRSDDENDDISDLARSVVGQNILIFNRSGLNLYIIAPLRYGSTNQSSFVLKTGYFFSADCKMESGEIVRWEYVTGKNRY